MPRKLDVVSSLTFLMVQCCRVSTASLSIWSLFTVKRTGGKELLFLQSRKLEEKEREEKRQ